MSDANEPGTGAGPEAGPPQSSYKMVPSAQIASDADLYSFRAEMPPPPMPVIPTPPLVALAQNKNFLMAFAIGGGILLAVLAIIFISMRQEQPQAYIDLGTKSIPASGLEGRAVVKWVGQALYQLHIDPVVPQQLDGFSTVAAGPPYPISIDVKLKDASGEVVCQKEILFPYYPAQNPASDPAQALLPQKSTEGDTVQNVAAADGRIAEIVLDGYIPCPARLYKSLDSWEFSSNFPAVADQQEWANHQQGIAAVQQRSTAESHARAVAPKIRPLPAAIEGDDVIVSDNPSKGSVETRDGKVFLVGKGSLSGRTPGWQVFPAAIHFHCDVKAACVLTRPDASAPLQARLLH